VESPLFTTGAGAATAVLVKHLAMALSAMGNSGQFNEMAFTIEKTQ
jgi:hypothetical protein